MPDCTRKQVSEENLRTRDNDISTHETKNGTSEENKDISGIHFYLIYNNHKKQHLYLYVHPLVIHMGFTSGRILFMKIELISLFVTNVAEGYSYFNYILEYGHEFLLPDIIIFMMCTYLTNLLCDSSTCKNW